MLWRRHDSLALLSVNVKETWWHQQGADSSLSLTTYLIQVAAAHKPAYAHNLSLSLDYLDELEDALAAEAWADAGYDL